MSTPRAVKTPQYWEIAVGICLSADVQAQSVILMDSAPVPSVHDHGLLDVMWRTRSAEWDKSRPQSVSARKFHHHAAFL